MSDTDHTAAIQAELQTYLANKNFHSMFSLMVENLLTHKPDNPMVHIIEYLLKTYPEETKPITARFKSEEPASSAAPAAAAANGHEHADEDSDDNDDDVHDEPVKIKRKGRGMGVSAESMDPEKLKEQMSQVTCIEKSEDVKNRLLQVVAKSPLLRTLDDDQKEMIVKAFSGPITKQEGENIIVQGEIGETFYLLEEGKVDVYVKKGDAEEMKVHTYQPGSSFGELALMYNAPRAATCRAASECKLWQLDRVSFRVIVVAATMQKREVYAGFLKNVPILANLSDMEIMALADALAEEKYEDGSTVCTQGEPGDYFYIIKGTAVCTKKNAETGAEDVVANLDSGKYFGEIALLTEKPRQATVKASGLLKVLALDRATFTRVFGPMDDILKRNMDQYNLYAAKDI